MRAVIRKYQNRLEYNAKDAHFRPCTALNDSIFQRTPGLNSFYISQITKEILLCTFYSQQLSNDNFILTAGICFLHVKVRILFSRTYHPRHLCGLCSDVVVFSCIDKVTCCTSKIVMHVQQSLKHAFCHICPAPYTVSSSYINIILVKPVRNCKF